MFSSDGRFIDHINTGDAPLFGPQSVLALTDDRICVCDPGHHCIKIYSYKDVLPFDTTQPITEELTSTELHSDDTPLCLEMMSSEQEVTSLSQKALSSRQEMTSSDCIMRDTGD